MLKRKFIVFLLFASTSLFAQEVEVMLKEEIPVEKEVVDLFVSGNKTLLLTKDQRILEVKLDGKVTASMIKGSEEFYELRGNGSLPQNFDAIKYQYLTRGDDVYFACFFNRTYSSRIVKIDTLTGDKEWFCYTKGIPSGMISLNGELWYLSNRGDGTELLDSIVRCYNQVSPMPVIEQLIPVLDAKGLWVDDNGIFTTYENHSHSLIRFKITGGKGNE